MIAVSLTLFVLSRLVSLGDIESHLDGRLAAGGEAEKNQKKFRDSQHVRVR